MPVKTMPVLHRIIRDNAVAELEAMARIPEAELEARHGARSLTPLMAAVKCGRHCIVGRLLSRGADATAKDAKGRTAFDLARDERTLIKLLLAVCWYVELDGSFCDADGYTPVHGYNAIVHTVRRMLKASSTGSLSPVALKRLLMRVDRYVFGDTPAASRVPKRTRSTFSNTSSCGLTCFHVFS